MVIFSQSSDDIITPNSRNTIVIVNPPAVEILINNKTQLNRESTSSVIKKLLMEIFGRDMPSINNIIPPKGDQISIRFSGYWIVIFRSLNGTSKFDNADSIIAEINKSN